MRSSAFLLILISLLAAPSFAFSGDRAKGEKLYRQKCRACHSLSERRRGVGPHFLKLFGRKAGSVANFRYSRALKEAGEKGMVWTTENVGVFLAAPKAFVKPWTWDRPRHGVTCKKNGNRKEIRKDLWLLVDCAVPLSAQSMEDLSAFLSEQ